MSGGCLGELKRLMDSQNPKYSKYDQTSDFLPVPPNHQNDLKWTKSSDPMYGGSNELFGRNKNFPLVSNIKLHLKMSVNYQLQISPPPYQYAIAKLLSKREDCFSKSVFFSSSLDFHLRSQLL